MVDEPLPCILNAGREAVTLPKEGDLGGDVGISDFGFRISDFGCSECGVGNYADDRLHSEEG